MEQELHPYPVNYPEIKPDDTDQMLRERCLLYVLGNSVRPSYFMLHTKTELRMGIEACMEEAQKLFEFIKTGTITTASI